MSLTNRLSTALLRSPIAWGALATLAFYVGMEQAQFAGPFLKRYFASHPIEYAAMAAFFIALASLGIKLLDVLWQSAATSRRVLDDEHESGNTVQDVPELLDELDELPETAQSSLLVRRVRAGLEHVRRRGSADELEEELRTLSEHDAERLYANYALVRLIIWAIPILGFLGTVIGITLALANLAPTALEDSITEVAAGLGVAFDTTAQALALSMLLMFAQYVTDRAETRLLERIDRRASNELTSRFARYADADPQVAAVRRVADEIIASTGRLVERQAELWKSTIDAAHTHWARMAAATENELREGIREGVREGLTDAGQQLTAGAAEIVARQREQWERLHALAINSAEASSAQQGEVARQAELLARLLDTAGELTTLERSLDRNLASLSGAQHFEEALHSLTAATHLLTARFGPTQGDARAAGTPRVRHEGQAA